MKYDNPIMWACMVVMFLIGSIVYYNIKDDANDVMLAQKAMEQGMEQCTKNTGGYPSDTIWVKSCSEYLKSIKKMK